MAFDVSKMTLGEIAKVEQIAGISVSLIEHDEAPKGMLLAGLAYVIQKRSDPSYTLARAEALTLEEATDMLDTDADSDDPEADAGEPAFPKAQS